VNITSATLNIRGYNVTNATTSYQEFANAQAFSGDWGNSALLVDGDWGTESGCSSGTCHAYVNYTRPDGFNYLFWERLASISGRDNFSLNNINKRRVLSREPIQLNFRRNSVTGVEKFTGWNGTDFMLISNDDWLNFYEEAVYWNVYPTNITIDTGNNGQNDFENTTKVNTTETVNLNFTAINNYLHETCNADWDTGNCALPLNISVGTEGIVGIDNITFEGEYLYGTYDINVFDEITGDTFNTSDMTLTAICEDDIQIWDMTNHTLNNITISCDLIHLQLEIIQDGDAHWRTLILDRGYNETIEFYMINITNETARRQEYKIYDITQGFSNGTISAYKNIPDVNKKVVIEQRIDAENKVVFYLIDGETYEIIATNAAGTSTRVIGNIIGDSDASKNIEISAVRFLPDQDLVFKDVFIYFYLNETTKCIYGVYNDTLGLTTAVTFTVYNASMVTHVMYATTSTASDVLFIYNNVAWNNSYIIVINATHSTYGRVTEQTILGIENRYLVSNLVRLGVGIYMAIAAGMISMLALLVFSRKHAKVGPVVMVVLIAMFKYWGWFDSTPQISWPLITLLAFIVFASLLGLRKRS